MTKLTDLSNVDAENEVLGMAFIKQDVMLDISRELTGKDFSRQSNQILFEKLKMMAATGEHINLITVTEGMRKDGTLEKVGGLSYLAYINQKTFTTAGLQEDIRVIKEYSQRREMLRFSHDLDNAAGDMTRNVDEIAVWMGSVVDSVQSVASNGKSTKDATQVGIEFMSYVDQRYEKKNERLVTQLTDVDKKIGGFEPGQLVILAGRPGHGKSALATTIATNLALKGHGVLYFSMEMSATEVYARVVSRLGAIDSDKLKRPELMQSEDWDRLITGSEKAGRLPIFFDERGMLSPDDVSATVGEITRTEKIEFIVIDYLQLMSSGRKSDSGNRVQEISYITRRLKNLAQDLGLPILLLSQLSRSNEKENRVPRLTDLRDSGSIEQDANIVILIHREQSLSGDMKSIELSNKTVVNIAKQRNGETGIVNLTFVPSRVCFANYIGDEAYARLEPKNFKAPT